jgi:formylglycine-generating enzyme required for sulfatase activity
VAHQVGQQASGRIGYFIGAVVVACLLVASGTALAQSQMTPGAPSVPLLAPALANGVQNRITYQYGTEFVTIGAPGNANWNPPPTSSDNMRGNGGIAYEYRIGRTEITTSQWVGFLNAAFARPQSEFIPRITVPSSWGATQDTSYTGPGQRFRVIAGRENQGVGDISWRAAAMYCNWLHNDQSTSRSAFLNGAYDVSTFGGIGTTNIFSDQLTRSEGARFWIPSLGEWMKAAYYDPNRNGPGQDGWWRYQYCTDTPLLYGSPERGGQANAGFTRTAAGLDARRIPMMSYVNSQSPWGVMDLAGGTEEWTEGVFTDEGTGYRERLTCGSSWANILDPIYSDRLGFAGAAYPSDEGFFYGFRIAASVPAPSAGAVFGVVAGVLMHRRRR